MRVEECKHLAIGVERLRVIEGLKPMLAAVNRHQLVDVTRLIQRLMQAYGI